MLQSSAKPAFDSRTFLAKAGEGRTIAKYAPNDVIFSQGEAADAVCYLQRGRIKISVLSSSGKEAVLAILGEGDFFGQNCLIGQARRRFTATAITECSVMRLEKGVMIRMLREEANFSEFVMSFLLSQTVRMQEDLIDQLFNSSEKRLARVLLLLANFGPDGAAQTIIPRVSQQTLAEMIGTTRSRVNVFMNNFRSKGFIDYNGEIRVHSSLLNVVLQD